MRQLSFNDGDELSALRDVRKKAGDTQRVVDKPYNTMETYMKGVNNIWSFHQKKAGGVDGPWSFDAMKTSGSLLGDSITKTEDGSLFDDSDESCTLHKVPSRGLLLSSDDDASVGYESVVARFGTTASSSCWNAGDSEKLASTLWSASI